MLIVHSIKEKKRAPFQMNTAPEFELALKKQAAAAASKHCFYYYSKQSRLVGFSFLDESSSKNGIATNQ